MRYRGEFWVATYGGGLIREHGGQWLQYSLDTLHASVEFDNYINGMFLDKDANLWLAGDQKGILYLNLPFLAIENFRSNRKKSSCLKNDEIYSVYQQGDELWLGTRGGGVYQVNEKSGLCRQYLAKPGENSLSGNRIYAITGQKDGTLWIAATGKGVNRLDSRSGEFKVYSQKNPASGILDDDVLVMENIVVER